MTKKIKFIFLKKKMTLTGIEPMTTISKNKREGGGRKDGGDTTL